MIWAIRDRATFESLRRSGRRVRRGPVTITWAPGVSGVPPRVAYSVGRKTGGAVLRNRVRRRLRAIVWELRHELSSGAYLVSGGDRVATMGFGELRKTVCEILQQLTPKPEVTGPTRRRVL